MYCVKCNVNKHDMSCLAQLTGNVVRTWLTFSQGSLKVINKHSSSNVNITFVQSYLVFNNVLKWLDKNVIYTSFVEGFLMSS